MNSRDKEMLDQDMHLLLEQSQKEEDPYTNGEPLAGDDVLIHRIASCGQGDVYLAYNFEVGRRVAVKLIPRGEDVSDEDWEEHQRRFLQETQILEEIQHPNIPVVKYFKAGSETLPPYLVMEYIDGDALGDDLHNTAPLDRHSVEWKIKKLGLFIEVCDALAIVHSRGLVHRDIKPDNLMITKAADGREIMKVIDFGIALNTKRSRRTREGLAIGTLGYLSPEQAHSGEINKLADVYALGAVLFEILHNEEYLEDQYNPVESLLQACNPDYFAERMNLLSSEARGFMNLAMALDSKDRFGGMYEFMGALKVLIRQLEYMRTEGVTKCPYKESQQILLTEALELHEFFGAVRMLARQYEFSFETGYSEMPSIQPRPEARHSSLRQNAVNRDSIMSSRDTMAAPDSYLEQVAEQKGRFNVKRTIIGFVIMVGIFGLVAGLSVGYGKWQRQSKSKPHKKRTYTSSAIVHNDAQASKPAKTHDASTKPDVAVLTPAQKTKALYIKRDNWCKEKDPRAEKKGYVKMRTFHLDCHYKYLYTVAFTLEKYDSAFRYAKYLHKEFCTDRRRKKAEPHLAIHCNRLLHRYKRILNRTYLKNPKAHKKYREWLPFTNYWAIQRRKRKKRK